MLSNPNCLLSQVFLRKYCHNANLLKVKATKSSSHGWTGILAGRDLLIKHLGKVVGDGTETIVWFDPWISTTQAMIPRGPLKEDSRDLYVSDLITRGSCQWNKEEIMNVLPDFIEEILSLRSSKT